MTDINTYTTAEISALTPQSGDLVLNTETNAVQLWNGAAWKVFDSDVSPFPQQYSLKFDGTNESLHGTLDSNNTPIASSQITLGSADAWTISFWYKNDNVSINDTSLFNGSGSDYFRFNVNSSGHANIMVYDGGMRVRTGNQPTIDLRNWTHVAYTHDGSGLHKMYVNGSLPVFAGYGDGTATYTGDFQTYGWIYGRASTATPDAYLDEVAFFASDLSSSISTLYNGGVAGDLDSLNPTYWYRMEEGSGSSVANSGSVGSGADLATSNSPTFSTDIPS